QRLPGDVHLRDEARQSGRRHCEVNVRGTAGIGHRPDRHKAVAARGVGDGSPEALEVVVPRPLAAAVLDIVVAAVAVALPDLDAGTRERPPGTIDNTPGDAGDSALRGFGVSGDVDEIVVG